MRGEANDTHKVYPDGADVAVREGVVRETQQQARFAHSGIADKHELEEVIAGITQKKTPISSMSFSEVTT